MQPGDWVAAKTTYSLTGHPAVMGRGYLVKKIGTVPDFWEVKVVGPHDGHLEVQAGTVIRVFVYPQDIIEEAHPRPVLRVIQGGKEVKVNVG